jgi:hypothetical protein
MCRPASLLPAARFAQQGDKTGEGKAWPLRGPDWESKHLMVHEYHPAFINMGMCRGSSRLRAADQDLDWEPDLQRNQPLVGPSKSGSRAPPPPPPPPPPRSVVGLTQTQQLCVYSMISSQCAQLQESGFAINSASTQPGQCGLLVVMTVQGWWEAPFTSRRNIALTMLAGSAGLWLVNNSESMSRGSRRCSLSIGDKPATPTMQHIK